MDDDALDDLLCDTSASKFKNPAFSGSSILPSSGSDPLKSKLEKKSALLAELFGPTSFTDITSSLNDDAGIISNQEVKQNKVVDNFSTAFSTGEEVIKSNVFSLGDYIPSNTGSKSSFTLKNDRFNGRSSTLHQESKEIIDDSFSKSVINSKHIENQLYTSSSKDNSSLKNSLIGNSTNFNSKDPAPTDLSSGEEKRPVYVDEKNVSRSLHSDLIIPRNPSLSENQLLTSVKELIENFSTKFCQELSALTGKDNGFKQITETLVALEKCLSKATDSWTESLVRSRTDTEARNNVNSELEKQVVVLENKVLTLVSENANLSARMQTLEKQHTEDRNEISKFKLEIDFILKNQQQQWAHEIASFESKLATLSSQLKKDEETKEAILRAVQQQVVQLEDRVNCQHSNDPSVNVKDEVSKILGAELKWLQRQKKKLDKNNRALHYQIVEKFHHFDLLTMELSKVSHKLKAKSILNDDKILMLDQKLKRLVDKEEQLKSIEKVVQQEKTPNQLEELGLAMWNLHVKTDEQRLEDQFKFLQILNKE